jgi:hypothetical protein
MAGHNVSFASAIPQFLVINRSGDSIAALTGHTLPWWLLGERSLAVSPGWRASKSTRCHQRVNQRASTVPEKMAISCVSFLHVALAAYFSYLCLKALLYQGVRCKNLYGDCSDCSEWVAVRIVRKSPVMEV